MALEISHIRLPNPDRLSNLECAKRTEMDQFLDNTCVHTQRYGSFLR